ncbi:hypothetical protein PHYSODRAFT_327369 [Phytophthora sojae]|uniref:RxLR effector protein n=1 Tax=Phytophthora sojae (strain P6497) TaxID=1094619 RepID=G4YT73_PHYSP|nr:hypothetical protein PHYSODRAFT_327369 [Phytophthora sojae]EGZ26467.1 hypothetical protein PHYSODRAFT_327369 [Phytophthora sojae]|eukprot:XP_009521755.1 hypothetical protein PHYSODRAFT_327369 [Phytophthora sojae]
MKPSQFIFALFIAAVLESACAIGSDYQAEAAVEVPARDAIQPLNALRRIQITSELSEPESAGSASWGELSGAEPTGSASAAGNSASASTSTAETEAPTTIMVLLPDNLAPSYSGSGSVMFFDGSVGDDDKKASKSASSDSAADKTSNAASGRNFGVAVMLTASTILSALLLA